MVLSLKSVNCNCENYGDDYTDDDDDDDKLSGSDNSHKDSKHWYWFDFAHQIILHKVNVNNNQFELHEIFGWR